MPHDFGDVTIRLYEPGDERGILETFNRVFQQQRTVEAWQWQYRDNPAGLHCYLAVHNDGRVLSQFTGIPRRMKLRNGTACFAEIVDSMTDPTYRAGLKKPGLFATTCYHFVDHYGRSDREVIMYGLPNPPAFRIGSALLGYVHLYDVSLMTKDLTSEPLETTSERGIPAGAQVVSRFSPDVDEFFVRASEVHEILTIRDARYLNWRYAERPDARYELLEFRDPTGLLFGVAALRHQWLGQPTTAVAELFLLRDHPALPSAISRVESSAIAANSARIQAFFRPESPEVFGLGAVGYHPEPSPFRFVARTYDKSGVPLDWLKSALYLSLGDFDIV